MKKNLPVTQRQYDYPESIHIVSATDLNGNLTYVNKDFVEVSGFAEAEMITRAHSIVRHPDMPPAAFADLWRCAKAGQPWMGVVKNRRKNGDHYWVNAFVTPLLEAGKVVGYQSVRVKPTQQYVTRAERLYATLWKPAGALQKVLRWRPNLGQRIAAGVLGTALLTALAATQLAGWLALAGTLTVALVCAAGFASWFAAPYRRAARLAREVVDNPVAQAIYTGRGDEAGQLELAIKFLQSELNTVVWRISDASINLQHSASQAADTTVQTERDMQRQKQELELVATAMNEMSATVQEVAGNAANAAEATRLADSAVNEGQKVVNASATNIRTLARQIEETEAVIARLAEDSSSIGRVVDVIRSVAEQTNLLALNAAIEAARAGEQGRGFAVVAEEVRSLAQSTQSSTGEIQELIKRLQHAAAQAETMMEQGQRGAQESVTQAENADKSLQAIAGAVATIMEMSTQIATAAEEQSAVSEEINRNIININSATEQTLDASRSSRLANQELVDEVERLQTMVTQFAR